MPEPLSKNIQSLQFSDQEIKRLAANAANETARVLKSLEGKTGQAARVRAAQVQLANTVTQMWADVGDATKIGIGDAVWGATETQALVDEELFSKAGISSRYWRSSMLQQAKSGIETLISRKENGITLSQRVYKNAALTKGHIDKTINNGLLLGKSAAEIAKDVVGFIDPNVPGGASSAAMRLGRSEINNAFHTTSINHMKNTPWVERAKWNLSGSHGVETDECNEYAENSHIPKGDAGEFLVEEVPAKPHPNCLCYLTPVTMDLDSYAKAFKQGKFDNYIDKQMGCMSVG